MPNVYKNKLGLEAIPFIEGMQARPGVFFGIFDNEDDEFIHIADTLEQWRQNGKSLADHVRDEAHRKALLFDLYHLEKLKRLELKEGGIQSLSINATDRIECFLQKTLPYEEGMLLSWEAPTERESRFDFEKLRGFCLLTYQNGAVSKLRLELQDNGLYFVAWVQAGDIGEEKKPIADNIKIDSAAPCIIQLAEPKRSGTFLVYRQTNKLEVEEIPA